MLRGQCFANEQILMWPSAGLFTSVLSVFFRIYLKGFEVETPTTSLTNVIFLRISTLTASTQEVNCKDMSRY